jgi:hypothetical protein
MVEVLIPASNNYIISQANAIYGSTVSSTSYGFWATKLLDQYLIK